MVIMMDKAMSPYLSYALYEYPKLQESFKGFTYYPNTISFARSTNIASPALFGGYSYTPVNIDLRSDIPLVDKHDDALRMMPLIFSDAGYEVSLIDLPYAGYHEISDNTVFDDIENTNAYVVTGLYDKTDEQISQENRICNMRMVYYSLFRCSPILFRSAIYDDGNYNSFEYIMNRSFNSAFHTLCSLSDLTVIDEEQHTGCLFMMDNDTMHNTACLPEIDQDGKFISNGDITSYPFMISNGTESVEVSDYKQEGMYDCFVAGLFRLADYFDYLREIGVYDNTRIIIVADHGYFIYQFDDLVFEKVDAEYFNPLLMVKDFDSEEFTVDDSFMTNADVPTLAMQGIIDDPVDPATGIPVNSDPKNSELILFENSRTEEEVWDVASNNGNTFNYGTDGRFFRLVNQNLFDEDNWIEIDYQP